ncbi:MAG: cobalt-precorrin 5A hydrolase [Methanobacteriaceae archaeon]|nr:cobalt-precorrin 5A hydrolase [Methanobacteriaceae archaeon]
MKIAILSVSKHGKELANNLKINLEQDSTIMHVQIFHKNAKNNLIKVFNDFDAIIGIMALGIMVRISCGLISNKITDPAIIVIDDCGNNVISLLSGHLGGANNLTIKIADLIDSNPVITTSTDIHGFVGIDEMARGLHWEIMDPKLILNFNSFIIKGEKVGLFSNKNIDYLLYDPKISKTYQYSPGMDLKDNFNRSNQISNNFQENDILAVNCSEKLHDMDLNSNDSNLKNDLNKSILNEDKNINNSVLLILRPKKLVIGIGSRKGVSKDQVISSIKKAAEILNLPWNRFDLMATAEIKQDEKGILEASNELNIPLEIVKMDQIKEFESEQMHPSEFVENTFGVKGVCEPAALLIAGDNSKLIFKKTAFNGVTIAVAVSDN